MQTATDDIEPRTATVEMADGALSSIARLPVPLSVQLGHERVKLRDLCRLVPGAVLELSTADDASQKLTANSRLLATGEIVRSGNRIGFRVRHLAESQERPGTADLPAK